MKRNILARGEGRCMVASRTSSTELLEVSRISSRKVVDSYIENDRMSNMNLGGEMVGFEAIINSTFVVPDGDGGRECVR